jgi:hypothetical protein
MQIRSGCGDIISRERISLHNPLDLRVGRHAHAYLALHSTHGRMHTYARESIHLTQTLPALAQ